MATRGLWAVTSRVLGADLRNGAPKPQPRRDTGPLLPQRTCTAWVPCGLQVPQSPRASSQRNPKGVAVRNRRVGFIARGTHSWGPCRLLAGTSESFPSSQRVAPPKDASSQRANSVFGKSRFRILLFRGLLRNVFALQRN